MFKATICHKFGIHQSTLTTIIKQRKMLVRHSKAVVSNGNVNICIQLKAVIEKHHEYGFKQTQTMNLPISGLKFGSKKAKLLTQQHSREFHTNSGRLQRFKTRHGIVFKCILREYCSIKKTVFNRHKTSLQANFRDYRPHDIFNANKMERF